MTTELNRFFDSLETIQTSWNELSTKIAKEKEELQSQVNELKEELSLYKEQNEALQKDLEKAQVDLAKFTEAAKVFSSLVSDKKPAKENGSYSEHIQSITKKLEEKPDDPDLYFKLGFNKHMLGEYAAAKEALLQAVDNGYDQKNWMLWYYLAKSSMKLDEKDKAEEYSAKAVESAPDEGMSHYLRAEVLLLFGKKEEASLAADEAKKRGINIEKLKL